MLISPRWQLMAYATLMGSLSAGYGVLFTLMGDYRDTYGIGETALGWIIALGFISSFVAQLLVAPLGDRGHTTLIIRAGVLANVVGLLILAGGQSAWVLAAGRLVSGLATGAVQPVIQRQVILLDPDNVGRNLGRMLSAAVFGFAVGPAISAATAESFGLAAPFLIVAAFGVASLLLAGGGSVPSTTTDESPAGGEPAELADTSRLALDLLSNRSLLGALCLGGAVYAMIGAFDALWDVVHADLKTPTRLANLGISLFALPLVILAPTGGRLAERLGPVKVAAVGLLIGAGYMASYGWLPTGASIVGVSLLHSFSDGLTMSAPGIAVASSVPADRHAGAQGLLGAMQALCAAGVAATTGWLYATSGRPTAYVFTSVTMIVLVLTGLALSRQPVATKPSL